MSETEIKNPEQKNNRTKIVLAALAALVIATGIGGLIYWYVTSQRVYTDNADLEAPVVNLAPTTSGTLQEVFVNKGDQIAANTVVAQVGNELIKSKTAGIVSDVEDNVGAIFNPGETVVTMYDPTELRVVAHVDEDKGLSDIQIGQHTVFTVDAFGSKKYQGVVDEISPSARQNDIVFSISDARPTNVFDVKIRFDTTEYPELENGMSAKVWIYK